MFLLSRGGLDFRSHGWPMFLLSRGGPRFLLSWGELGFRSHGGGLSSGSPTLTKFYECFPVLVQKLIGRSDERVILASLALIFGSKSL